MKEKNPIEKKNHIKRNEIDQQLETACVPLNRSKSAAVERTCLSLKDRFCLPLAFCFNIIKLLFLHFSRLVVLACGLTRFGFLVGFSRSARPSCN
jgi:hypothetical protein